MPASVSVRPVCGWSAGLAAGREGRCGGRLGFLFKGSTPLKRGSRLAAWPARAGLGAVWWLEDERLY